MANITKRGDTFRVKISCGYNIQGKQVIKSMTYKPDPTKSDKWNEKELNRQVVLFEEQCQRGKSVTSAKFETFAREWFTNYAELKLKKTTLRNYHGMEKRTYEALGHIRIDRINPIDIQRYVRTLSVDGLSPANIKNHVRFVSVILSYAVKKQVINYNPCVAVDYPIQTKTEREFYTTEEVKQFLTLLNDLEDEKKPIAMFFTLAAYTGARKSEIRGLEWSDIDFDNSTLSINRAYHYSSYHKEHFTTTPKTAKSRRSLKLPTKIMEALAEYRQWQDEQRKICCGSWIETGRIITAWNGTPLCDATLYKFLENFCKRTGMRKVNIHSFRHFNASVLINSGVDVVTVQTALGHSTPTTTLSIYSHAFNTAQTRAMEAIANAIDL